MTADDVTFGLALIGYALLSADFARQHTGRSSTPHSVATATVVTAHVLCVWGLRFDWSVAQMWQKSVAGFLLFHSALLLIVAIPALRDRRRPATNAAFALVTAGALPAPFRYPELSLSALPLFAIAALSLGCVIRARRGGLVDDDRQDE